jgi:hypothetical protein
VSKKGEPRNPKWSAGEIAALRLCAERGLSTRQTAVCVGRSWSAVMQIAQRLGVSFHGAMGAPKGNRNRHLGELKKEMQRIISDSKHRIDTNCLNEPPRTD